MGATFNCLSIIISIIYSNPLEQTIGNSARLCALSCVCCTCANNRLFGPAIRYVTV